VCEFANEQRTVRKPYPPRRKHAIEPFLNRRYRTALKRLQPLHLLSSRAQVADNGVLRGTWLQKGPYLELLLEDHGGRQSIHLVLKMLREDDPRVGFRTNSGEWVSARRLRDKQKLRHESFVPSKAKKSAKAAGKEGGEAGKSGGGGAAKADSGAAPRHDDSLFNTWSTFAVESHSLCEFDDPSSVGSRDV